MLRLLFKVCNPRDKAEPYIISRHIVSTGSRHPATQCHAAAAHPIPSASAVQRRHRQFRQVRSFWDCDAAVQVHFVQPRPCAGPFRFNAAAAAATAACARHKNVIFGPLVLQRNAAATGEDWTDGWPTLNGNKVLFGIPLAVTEKSGMQRREGQ